MKTYLKIISLIMAFSISVSSLASGLIPLPPQRIVVGQAKFQSLNECNSFIKWFNKKLRVPVKGNLYEGHFVGRCIPNNARVENKAYPFLLDGYILHSGYNIEGRSRTKLVVNITFEELKGQKGLEKCQDLQKQLREMKNGSFAIWEGLQRDCKFKYPVKNSPIAGEIDMIRR